MTGSKADLSMRVYRWEGLLFNLFCALYFLTIGPGVTDAGYAAMHGGDENVVWLGILLLSIMLLEVYAFPKKMRFVRAAAQKYGDDMGSGFLLWMFHTVISIVLLFTVAGAFGVKIEEGVELPVWLMVAIPVVVIKELWLLMGLFGSNSENTEERYDRPNRKEWVLDGILILYACVGYSCTWAVLVRNVGMDRDEPVMYIVNLLVSFLIFLIFYLPLRIPYWLEEIARVKSRKDVFVLIGSLLLVYVPTIWGLR